MSIDSMKCSLAMLRDVIDGQTYEAIGQRHGITRTAVEQRIKQMARRLVSDVGVDGLSERTAAYVERLRQHRSEVILAIERFEPLIRRRADRVTVLSDDDIHLAAMRISSQSSTPRRDLALFYVLLSTGLRPLELARLTVADYLDEQGEVRRESLLRAETAVNQLERPLFFLCANTCAALDHYLQQRRVQGFHCREDAAYRGLDPGSPLFLGKGGQAFAIHALQQGGHLHVQCRQILDQLRKIFAYIRFPGITALSLRQTLAARLYERGASDEQVAELLGILDLNHVRQRYPRPYKPLATLVRELV